MTDTINNGIPLVPENTIDPAAGLNLALLVIDRLLQLKVIGMKIDTPPGSPTAGDRYIVGTSPTGAWAGKELQVAEWMPEGYWGFSPASVAVYATSVYINTGSDWVPATDLDTGWQNMTLLNSWVAFDADSVPQYRRIGKVVYLRGVLSNDFANNGTAFWTIPAELLPVSSLYLATAGAAFMLGNARVYCNAPNVQTLLANDTTSPSGTVTVGLTGLSWPID